MQDFEGIVICLGFSLVWDCEVIAERIDNYNYRPVELFLVPASFIV